jgi:hypothetical protein
VRCKHCQRGVRGNYQPPRQKKDGTDMPAQWFYVCTGTVEVPKICTMPAFNGERVENEVWNWLVGLITNPSLVAQKLRARQQELTTFNAPHLERIETINSLITEKRAERNLYISMAGKKIITEDELEALGGRLLKEISELEQQRAKTEDKVEQPFSDDEIAAIITDSHELAKTRDLFLNASDELKRRNLERYRVRVELEAPADKVRVAHVECVLGSNTLSIPFGKTFIPACWCAWGSSRSCVSLYSPSADWNSHALACTAWRTRCARGTKLTFGLYPLLRTLECSRPPAYPTDFRAPSHTV